MIHSASPHAVPAGSDCCLILKFWDVRTSYGRTICVKIVITIGRDCGRPRGSNIILLSIGLFTDNVLPQKYFKKILYAKYEYFYDLKSLLNLLTYL